MKTKWSISDLNRPPIDCEPIALPDELMPRNSAYYTEPFFFFQEPCKSIKNVARFVFICLVVSLSLFFVSCSQSVYGIQLEPDVFSLIQNKSLCEKCEDGTFLLYMDKKIKLIAAGKDSPVPYCKLAEITTAETADSPLNEEIDRKYLFPCIPFCEDLPIKTYNTEESPNSETANYVQMFYFDDIPAGYIALPLESEGKNIYADNDEYTLFSSVYAECVFSDSDTIKSRKIKKNLPLAKEKAEAWFRESFAPAVKWDSKPKVLFVCSAGDMMLGRGVDTEMIESGSPDSVFTNTLPILQSSDLTIGNLEGTVTDKTENAQKTYTFKFKKEVLPVLKQCGFSYLMLTNNHSYDYGEEGFKDTLKNVLEQGFVTSGAGMTLNEASEFYRTQIKNQAVSVLSCGAFPQEQSGFNGKTTASAKDDRAGILWASEQIPEMIGKEKQQNRIVIMNVHGGSEYVTKPTPEQRTFYQELADAGADVVFGSHPHVLQPVEWYNNSLIVWSLGNFVFPGMDEMPGAEDSMIIRVGFVKGRLVYYEKYTAKLNGITVSLKE